MIHYVMRPVANDPTKPNYTNRDLGQVEKDVNAFTQDSNVTVTSVQPFCEWDGVTLWVGAMIQYTMRPR